MVLRRFFSRAALAAALATVLAVASLAGSWASGAGSTAAAADTSSLPSPAEMLQTDDSVVTADALPTVQLDSGYIWAQAMIGDTVYAVGSFSATRAAGAASGSATTARSNILSYDITTGALLDFAPTVNGVIKSVAVSPDGSRVYIGGSFTKVNGQTRYNFAALDAVSGALVSGFSPSVGGSGVYGIAVTADTVYVAGLFTQANGVARKNLAAFQTSNGALSSWAPTTDRQVDALVMEPGGDRVIAGGRFVTVNGATQRGLAAIDPATGVVDTGWAAPATVTNGSTTGKAGIFSLTTDATGVYGTGWVYGSLSDGNLEGVFAAEADSGEIRWVSDCHGDHYGVWSTGDVVYATSHTHACETVGLWPEQSTRSYRYIEAYTAEAGGVLTRSASAGSTYADWSGTASPSPYAWYPDFTVGTASGLGQAGLSITGSGDYIAVAGEFTSVNGQQFQGIVRFSTSPSTGAKQGPRISASSWGAPTAVSNAPGRAAVSIAANWDRDDRDLTYRLIRDGSVVAEKTVASGWWSRPTVTLQESGLTGGQQYTYQIMVVDDDGNAVTSQTATVTAAGGESSSYADMVLDDGASIYYPLGDQTANWSAAGGAPVIGSGVTTQTPGAVAGTTGETASSFSGTGSGAVATSASLAGSNTFSLEVWMKTTTTTGGKLIGFENTQTGSSGSHDRQVYLRNDGRLTFGVYPGSVKTVTSDAAYNDGEWHHVVATEGKAGIALYVDGVLVAQDTTTTSAQSYSGYWRIGGGTVGNWPSAPTSGYLDGTLDEAAVYDQQLSADQVRTHYAVGLDLSGPSAAFTATTDELSVSVDAGSSVQGDGAITAYDWDFGDGTTGTDATASHDYAAAGTYTVTLSVTDEWGLVSTSEQDVVVAAANVAPTAAFTANATALSLTVDGSASRDSDGEIVSYSWDWGDGGSLGSGATASHDYAEPGEYTVVLTVTDDGGETATVSQPVTVAEQAYAASDDFERTASSGWGSADVGGAWSMLSGAASAATVSDGAGRLTIGAGGTRNVGLTGTPLRDVRISVDVSLDQAPTTGASYIGLLARATTTDNYTVRAWLRADGSVWLVLQRGSTVLASTSVSGVARAAGDTFTIAAEITGGTTTTISAKLWAAGSDEPADWQLTATDTSGLDAAAAVGLHASRSSSATGSGVFSFDDLRVVDLG